MSQLGYPVPEEVYCDWIRYRDMSGYLLRDRFIYLPVTQFLVNAGVAVGGILMEVK